MRTVTVEIPDDGVSETQVNRFAADLRAGHELIMLRRPTGIPDAEMPVVVARLAAMLQAVAAVVAAQKD